MNNRRVVRAGASHDYLEADAGGAGERVRMHQEDVLAR